MSFIIQNKNWFRTFVLVLFIISMLGIWDFDVIYISAQSPCHTYNSLVGKSFLSEGHFIRLNEYSCGIKLYGYEIISLPPLQLFFGILVELVEGNFTPAQIPDLIALIGILLIILPFLSNILLLRNHFSHRLQIINIIIWGVACLPTLGIFLLQTGRDEIIKYFYLLWGLWLYILLALGAITFEILLLKSDNKASTVM